MSKNIKTAKYAGFCRGVSQAVNSAKRLKEQSKDKKIWILGELIHNSAVIKELENLGIHTVHDISECRGEGICIVRTHGLPPEEIKKIKKSGLEIADLTCPDVKKVQNKAAELAQEGYSVLIIGNGGHPETAALKAYAEQYTSSVYVIQSADDLDAIEDVLKKAGRAGVIVQTTQKAELLQEIVSKLLVMVSEVKAFNTICKSTALRQKAAIELAENSDLMIVIGGRNSANTIHLAELASKFTRAVHIETADELDLSSPEILSAQNIGITAGASTPEYIINDVIQKISTI